jgi:hypothetical protein
VFWEGAKHGHARRVPEHPGANSAAVYSCALGAHDRFAQGGKDAGKGDGPLVFWPTSSARAEALHPDKELTAKGQALQLHFEGFVPSKVFYRNAKVCSHEIIENKGRSPNQSCTMACTHRVRIIMLGVCVAIKASYQD